MLTEEDLFVELFNSPFALWDLKSIRNPSECLSSKALQSVSTLEKRLPE